MRLFVHEMFANRISTFFSLDVIVSAIVVLRFAAAESARLVIPRRWLVLVATLLVGVSLGLPLFLYLREAQLERSPAAAQIYGNSPHAAAANVRLPKVTWKLYRKLS